MMGKTHRAIGYTTTLVLIVYTDIGVIPSLIGFIGCTAPDIDIKLKIRHRGITHWVLTSIVLYYLFSIFNKNIAYAFWINYILHLLADSLTVEGCPLFAPFYNKRIGLKLFRTNCFIEKLIYYILLIIFVFVLYNIIYNIFNIN